MLLYNAEAFQGQAVADSGSQGYSTLLFASCAGGLGSYFVAYTSYQGKLVKSLALSLHCCRRRKRWADDDKVTA